MRTTLLCDGNELEELGLIVSSMLQQIGQHRYATRVNNELMSVLEAIACSKSHVHSWIEGPSSVCSRTTSKAARTMLNDVDMMWRKLKPDATVFLTATKTPGKRTIEIHDHDSTDDDVERMTASKRLKAKRG